MNIFIGLALLSCLHFDQSYRTGITEGTKAVFLFHDGKNAHLVIRTDLKSEKGDLPAELAWVLPLPSVPSKYEEIDAGVFDDLASYDVVRRSRNDGVEKNLKMQATPQGIVVHAEHEVGNYRIQPIEILSENSGDELDRWLLQNHFNTMPRDKQRPYLKKGSVFLAIKMKLAGKPAELKPIHIVYASKTLSFPLRFTHDTRTFDLDLFVLSDDAELEPGIESDYIYKEWQITLMKPKPGSKLASLVGPERTGNLAKFMARGLNTQNKMLKNLDRDPTFAVK